MNENAIGFIKKSLYIFAGICIICFLVKKSIFGLDSVMDYLDIVEQAVTFTIPITILYGSLLWKFNPFEKTPRIMGEYSGIIEYKYLGQSGHKKTEVSITQTLFAVKVKIKTNEISSNTITGNFIKENDEYVLYYNYITNPQSQFSAQNPIQRGTCRLVPEDEVKSFRIAWTTKLRGIYWTSRQTVGDINLTKKKDT